MNGSVWWNNLFIFITQPNDNNFENKEVGMLIQSYTSFCH